jgi:hypothetical protein
MDNNRTIKKVFNPKLIGIRKTGRPKLRWEDDVIQDVKILGVKNWRNLAMENDFGNEEMEERINGKGKLAEACEEGQDSRRAVQPMMMMMISYGSLQ